MNNRHLVQKLRTADVIQRERVTLRSGRTSELYCDIKKAYGDPHILNALAEAVASELTEEETCVAASGYGGLPLAAVVASCGQRRFTAVRDAGKTYGTERTIDGHMPTEHDGVVVVDDVLTTGSSILNTLTALLEVGAPVTRAIVVVKREDIELPIPHSALFSIDELTQDAHKNNTQ